MLCRTREEASFNLVNDKCESVEAYSRRLIDKCAATVRQWSHGFPPDADVLQIGFEGGAIPQLLIDAGLRLHLVEASCTRLRIFRQVFAELPSACSEPGRDAFAAKRQLG